MPRKNTDERRLTPFQARFVQEHYARGCSNATEAYIAAGGPSKKHPRKIAHNMLQLEQVQEALANLQEKTAKKCGLDLETHLASLEAIRDKALADGQYGPAVTAETNRGKAVGIYVERKEVNMAVTLENWLDELNC